MGGKTVYSMNDVHVQVLLPQFFHIEVVNNRKLNINRENYANAGFFGNLSDGNTIPAAHLVVDGKIISNSATQASWINTARKAQTTLIVKKDNTLDMQIVSDISKIPNVKFAISGIPILKGGWKVQMADIKKEGWFGNEGYNTWHGLIGIRGDKMVYVASKGTFNSVVYLMECFGVNNCIKLDGGGSFVLQSGGTVVRKTSENRKIHNIIYWDK